MAQVTAYTVRAKRRLQERIERIKWESREAAAASVEMASQLRAADLSVIDTASFSGVSRSLLGNADRLPAGELQASLQRNVVYERCIRTRCHQMKPHGPPVASVMKM
jgi:hypothetical protein